jgi:assimilatory nitrate reductase catalytic subunit
MASAVAAHNRAFGEDVVPCSTSDLDEADLIAVGSNTAWCHPVDLAADRGSAGGARHKNRRYRSRAAPKPPSRRTCTCRFAPDGDVALFNAAAGRDAKAWVAECAYLAGHVSTPEGFWEQLSGGDDGLDAATRSALPISCRRASAHGHPVQPGRQPVACGTDKGNAIINLHLATGRIGKPGMGPFSITGQPNAMGGREVGGLANMLACHMGFPDDERAASPTSGQRRPYLQRPGLKAVDMFRAVHDGRIKVPVGDGDQPRRLDARCGLRARGAGAVRLWWCPIASPIPIPLHFAHVRLPALAWGEKDGTVTNSERMVSRQRRSFRRRERREETGTSSPMSPGAWALAKRSHIPHPPPSSSASTPAARVTSGTP